MSDSCDPMDCSLPDSFVHGVPSPCISPALQSLPQATTNLFCVFMSFIFFFFLDSTYKWDRMIFFLCLTWWWWFSQVVSDSCNPMDCSPPDSSVHEIIQARRLEWIAISFFRGSSWPRDWTCVSCIAGKFFTTEPPGKLAWLILA